MKIIGIICEYNPFHLGHLYQINEIKKLYNDCLIAIVIPSCFMQRGQVSIINKWDKTKIALEYGIDLVLELPFVYSTQAADIFASGALQILNAIKIDTLIFGSESNNVDSLKEMANYQLNNENYDKDVKTYLNKGLNYPTAMSMSLKNNFGFTINSPNDILALSYIKEIIKNNYEIVPVSIKRTNDYHGDTVSSNIINASLLRKLFYEEKNIKKYIPNYNLDYLNKISLNDYFYYLKYQIINNKNRLSEIQTVDEGIENRILKQINDASSWTDLVEKIKTKRYTYNKINRMLVHILTNFTKEEAHNIKVDYLRILGFSKKGRLYLNKIKKDIDLPIITHYKKNISNILDIEFRVVEIYDLVAKQDLIKKEYSQKPLFKD